LSAQANASPRSTGGSERARGARFRAQALLDRAGKIERVSPDDAGGVASRARIHGARAPRIPFGRIHVSLSGAAAVSNA
jgi:hypothetical protein